MPIITWRQTQASIANKSLRFIAVGKHDRYLAQEKKILVAQLIYHIYPSVTAGIFVLSVTLFPYRHKFQNLYIYVYFHLKRDTKWDTEF